MKKVWLNRLYLIAVIIAGNIAGIYFELHPALTVLCILFVWMLPYLFDIIIAFSNAVEDDKKRKNPANTPRKLRGFIGGIPVYND
jgi:hypothetical protein